MSFNDMEACDSRDDIEILADRVAGKPPFVPVLLVTMCISPGHPFEFEDSAKAGIACEKGTHLILKLIDGDIRGQRELDFYQTLFSDDCNMSQEERADTERIKRLVG